LAVARSKEIARGAELDSLSARGRWDGEFVSLRYVGVHLIEEYAALRPRGPDP
jgi:hypothetical protein